MESDELKKRCIELFSGQRFDSFDEVVNGIRSISPYPEIRFSESLCEGNFVKFFEQAFDWSNMTYIFYPYMWGRKNNWVTTKQIEDPGDPVFNSFLQAGCARVVVPVRRGFEEQVAFCHLNPDAMDWLARTAPTSQGGGFAGLPITVGDPTYLSIAEELRDASSFEEDGQVYGAPYVTKVPTNLVYIVPAGRQATDPWPDLPDHSSNPDIAPWLK